jgi:hypothetical protein
MFFKAKKVPHPPKNKGKLREITFKKISGNISRSFYA